MKSRKVQFGSYSSKTVIMEGGVNENVSSIELKGGELLSCINYQVSDGAQGGYTSIAGYERYDGQALASSILASEADEIDREAQRDLIGQVPGIGAILGLNIFKNKVYAFRNDGALGVGMYVESPTGWEEVSLGAITLAPDGNYEFKNYNFKGSTATESMFWVDGVNKAMMFDGTTVTAINNSGMDPNDKPLHLAIHNERLFLAYSDGSLQYSQVSDPTEWTTGAGELGVGQEITNIVSTVGNTLIIYCEESIKILKGSGEETNWSLEVFSPNSGAYSVTATELLGDVFSFDSTGVQSLQAVQEYGDFAASTVSQKVQTTVQKYKNNSTVAIAARTKNQYRIFFDNNFGIYFTFLNKKLKGITIVKFNHPVKKATEGEDINNNKVIFFSSNSGFVYKMDSGTSFDGSEIQTELTTSYYHYGSPRLWKRFRSIMFEMYSSSNISFRIRERYDYADTSFLPKASEQDMFLRGSGSVWGEESWGFFEYSVGASTSRIIHYIKGLASNMSFTLITNSKYARQHTVQNFTTDYKQTTRQL